MEIASQMELVNVRWGRLIWLTIKPVKLNLTCAAFNVTRNTVNASTVGATWDHNVFVILVLLTTKIWIAA